MYSYNLRSKIIAGSIASIMVVANVAYPKLEILTSENYTITANAYSLGNYRVNTASGVKVRKYGTVQSVRVDGNSGAPNGTTFTVDRISGNWGHTNSIYTVGLNSTIDGWVCLTYCSYIGGETYSNSSNYLGGNYTVHVNTHLNIRPTASTSRAAIGSLRNGDTVTVTSTSGNWAHISSPMDGWVSLSYISPSSTNNGGTSSSVALSSGANYLISPACATGSVLDIQDGNRNNGANIQLWENCQNDNQIFTVIQVGNYYVFYDPKSQKVIDVSGGCVGNGTNVQLYEYNGTDSQLWYLEDAGGGYYYIKSKLNTSFCLDISTGLSNNGTNVQIYESNSSDAQKFRFTFVSGGSSATSSALGISDFSSEYKDSRYYSNLISCTRTGANRQTLANIALSQVGYKEGSLNGYTASENNRCEYNRWYYGKNVSGGSYPWCAVFISWCAQAAGIPQNIIPKTAGARASGGFYDWSRAHGKYKYASQYTPQVGDIAIFTWSHVGIVVGVNGNTVTVVEGNSSQAVSKYNYNTHGSDGKIGGYFVPEYTEISNCNTPTYTTTQATTNEQFIELIGNSAKKYYPSYNILPSLTTAQAILESGWGKSSLSKLYYNFFGMKAGSSYSGQTVSLKTGEEVNGVKITTTGTFRVYHSYEEGIEGYYKFITGLSRYRNLQGVKDYKTACRLIREDGWATDSQYTNKLINIIETYNLTRFDN